MKVDRDAIYVAAAGKAIERGLMPERQGNTLLIRYLKDGEATPKEDHLHRQVLRDLVARLSEGEDGFLMEAIPKAQAAQTPPRSVLCAR